MKTSLMQAYRKNPAKVQEIIKVAERTDMDRSELEENILFLGDDITRASEYSLCNGGIIVYLPLVGTITFGLLTGNFPLATAGVIGLGLAEKIPFMKWFPAPERPYREAHREALANFDEALESAKKYDISTI